MTQDEIRRYLGANESVQVQIAASGDGSPEMAWGDTFFYEVDKNGEAKKMPFTTIVIKDYEGYDGDSMLNRGGLYRLNIEVGKEKVEELFGFNPKELGNHRSAFDFAVMNQLFPHPLYGPNGWVSIISPTNQSKDTVNALLDFSLQRALSRAAV